MLAQKQQEITSNNNLIEIKKYQKEIENYRKKYNELIDKYRIAVATIDTLQNQLLHQKKQIEEDQEVKDAINTKLRDLLVKYHDSKKLLKKVEYKTKHNVWEVYSHKYN